MAAGGQEARLAAAFHFEGSEVKTSSRRASRAGFSAASVSKQAFGLGPTGACASFNYFLIDLSNKPGKSLCLNHSTGVQLCLWHRFSCVADSANRFWEAQGGFWTWVRPGGAFGEPILLYRGAAGLGKLL